MQAAALIILVRRFRRRERDDVVSHSLTALLEPNEIGMPLLARHVGRSDPDALGGDVVVASVVRVRDERRIDTSLKQLRVRASRRRDCPICSAPREKHHA